MRGQCSCDPAGGILNQFPCYEVNCIWNSKPVAKPVVFSHCPQCYLIFEKEEGTVCTWCAARNNSKRCADCDAYSHFFYTCEPCRIKSLKGYK